MPPQVLTELSPKVAFIIASVVIAIMGVTMIGFGWVPHLSLMLAIVVLLGLGMYKGLSFEKMQEQMSSGVVSGIGAIYLLFFIGLLVAALMMSGAIPTIMYYGFDLISPQYYYISAFVLTSIIFNIISKSKFYISTARYEGLPYSIIESLCLSKPIVATNVDGNRDLIREGVNGFLLSENNVKSFSAIVEKLLCDNTLLEKLGQNSKELFINSFDMNKNIRILERIYLENTKRKPNKLD